MAHRDLNAPQAYAILMEAMDGLPDRGHARARLETSLCRTGLACDKPIEAPARRADLALADLPDCTEVLLLRRELRDSLCMSMPVPLAAKQHATLMREARRRGDVGEADVARSTISVVLHMAGYHAKAGRHFQLEEVTPDDPVTAVEGLLEAATGRDRPAIERLQRVTAAGRRNIANAYLAAIWLRLGLYGSARGFAEAVDPAALASTRLPALLHAQVRSALALRDGMDPLAPIQEAPLAMHDGTASTLALDLLRWQVLCRTTTGAERAVTGRHLADALHVSRGLGVFTADVLVDLADAETDGARRRALALQAARTPRRRRGIFTTMVESTCRCADLLQATDPAEAQSLRHVARGWVVQALPHVPGDALHSHAHGVPIHRQLLGEDAEAAAAGRFDFR